MKLFFVLLFVSCSAFFVSCDESQNEVYMTLDDIVYISEFPFNVQLEKTAPIDLDLMGSVDMFANDSIVIFKYYNMDYFWRAFTLEDFHDKGCYLSRGTGPNEFTELPVNESFSADGSICSFWVPNSKKMYSVSLKKTLEDEALSMDTVIPLSIRSYVPYCMQINASTYFIVQVKGNSYRRSIFVIDETTELDHLKSLNDVHVQNELNAIGGVRVYNPDKERIVEGMLHLNQINLYSLNTNEMSKTICVGERLSNVNAIDKASKKEWIKFYGPMVVKDQYFAALYYNSTREEFLRGTMKKVDVQFFSWDGKPLLNISVPYSITSFFIYQDKFLYVFSANGESERLYKYDISSALREAVFH